MIRLVNVSLALKVAGAEPEPILQDATLALPTDSRLALLGDDPKALTETILLLSGSRKPDRGRISFDRMRCSPLVNSGSYAGRTLVPQLTVRENIRHAARTHGVDERVLADLVESACEFGDQRDAEVGSLDRKTRRIFECALIAAIPFDCYYIDRLQEIENRFIWQFVHVVTRRGAGMMYTLSSAKYLPKFTQSTGMLQDGSIQLRSPTIRALGHAN
jgi:hypothetical protein